MLRMNKKTGDNYGLKNDWDSSSYRSRKELSKRGKQQRKDRKTFKDASPRSFWGLNCIASEGPL